MSESKSKTLTRSEFRKAFIRPLEEAFGFNVYWNGKECRNAGLDELSGNACGESHLTKANSPIVLRFSKNNVSMIDTLIHEVAHSYLHGKGTLGYTVCPYAREIEAETVSLKVFNSMGIPLQGQLSYIQEHKDLYFKKHKEQHDFKEREDIINKLVLDIVEVLKDNSKFIKSLKAKSPTRKRTDYKYMVQCEICGYKWYYKRKCKIITTNAEGCWCSYCGKEKSIDELTVIDLP